MAFWELKDYWNYRWGRYKNYPISEYCFKIPITQRASLYSILILKSDSIDGQNLKMELDIKGISEIIQKQNYKEVILFLQGFSDDVEKIKHYTYGLALSGYAVISYDFRGVGKSRFSGLKNNFSLIVEDVRKVIDFLYSSLPLSDKKFNVVGISLGSIGTLISAFPDTRINKIVAVAAISDFKKNLPRYPVPFKGKWWIWLRYSFFAVDIYPNDEENSKISPIYIIENIKERFLKENESGINWHRFFNDRLRLIHCINDKIIYFHNFLNLVRVTGLDPENYYVFKKGGHMFKMYELALLSSIIDAIEH